jgi:hypothetical protein
MEYYDLIILVIANSSNIYDEFIKKYWLKFINYIEKNNINIKIYFLFDEIPTHLNIDNKYILSINKKTSLIPGVLEKTIFGFEYVYNNYDFKHIFRTNLSSFIILDKLLLINKELSNNNIYNGIIAKHNNIDFVSGSGFWLSKDNIQFIINNKNNINYKIIDDVSIGILLKDKKKNKLDRYNYNADRDKNNFQQIYNNILKSKHYHIRLKNNNRQNDIKFIEFLTNMFYN